MKNFKHRDFNAKTNHCAPCNIDFPSTRKLFAHQLTEEHIKTQRALKSKHAHSGPPQFSNRSVGTSDGGKADGGGLKIDRKNDSTAVSVNQSGMATNNDDTSGTKTIGPSTSINVNRATRPQQRMSRSTGSKGSDAINQSNLSTLADGAKCEMRKNTGSSGVRGGKLFVRRSSVVLSNRQRTPSTHLINQPAAPAGVQYRRVSRASSKPAQKVLRTVRQRNKRSKSVQRNTEPGGSGTGRQEKKRLAKTHQQQGQPTIVPDRGTSAVINKKEKTKSSNKQPQKQSVNLPKLSLSKVTEKVSTSVPSTSKLSLTTSPIHNKIGGKKVEMNMKYMKTEKVKPQQQDKSCGVREHLLLPPKKSVQSVAPVNAEEGGNLGRTPPKKNVERYNRFISIPIAPLKVEGRFYYQGEAAVPSTSSAIGTNAKSATVVATAFDFGRGEDTAPNASASPCTAKEGAFKATPPNMNPSHSTGLNSISSKNSTVGAAKSAARRARRLVSKSSAVPEPLKKRLLQVPVKALTQKKNSKLANSAKKVPPSGEKGKGAQSSQKGKPTKPTRGRQGPSILSDPANVSGKKKPAAAARGRVVAKAETARESFKTREVKGKAPPQKKNYKLDNRFNPIQASSKKDGVSHSPSVQSTKRSPGGIIPWLSATDRGSEVTVEKPTKMNTSAKEIPQSKPRKVRKKAKKVTQKQIKDYIPNMPGNNYEMPLLEAVSSYIDMNGKKLWICLVCSKAEPKKSSTPMICCDVCNDWYHFKCVGIGTKQKIPRKDPWYCMRCIYVPSQKTKNLKNK